MAFGEHYSNPAWGSKIKHMSKMFPGPPLPHQDLPGTDQKSYSWPDTPG